MFLIYFHRMKLLFKACLSPLVIPAIQPYLKTKFICVTPWVIHPVPLKSDAYMNRKHDALPLWTACELLRLRGDPSFVVVLPVLLSLSKHFSSALWFPSLCVWVCFILVLRKRVASTVQAGGRALPSTPLGEAPCVLKGWHLLLLGDRKQQDCPVLSADIIGH